jgi:hypothetical protein
MLKMDRYNEVTLTATREQAQAIIKRAKGGSTFNVSISMDLLVEGKPDHVFRDGGASYLSVSKAEMLRLIDSLLSETMEAKGARLRLRHYDRMSWKRGKPGHAGKDVLVTSYWIG